MSDTPNFFSTHHLMSATSCQWGGSTWAYDTIAFGFPASHVRIVNACGDRLWYSLKTAALTTKDGFLRGCSEVQIDGVLVGAVTLMTTSSSCSSRPNVSVSAWASA